jgi:hypothetical protein
MRDDIILYRIFFCEWYKLEKNITSPRRTICIYNMSGKYLSLIIAFSILIFFTSCQKDPENSNALISDTYSLAVISTDSVTDITHNTAMSGGNITDDGGTEITSKGICWSTSPGPTIDKSIIVAGTGISPFKCSMMGLALGTTYYVRSFATNKAGTAYGNQVTFTTIATLSIGAHYQGGIIFYLDTAGMHGLVCADSDQVSFTDWGCAGNAIPGADATVIGTGLQNTIDITGNCNSSTSYAAYICDSIVLNGYDDWFLPSKEELKSLYNNLKLNGIGNFSNAAYWSSTEMNANFAWQVIFTNGVTQGSNKNNQAAVRAVRVF